jgi:hypothetical protein
MEKMLRTPERNVIKPMALMRHALDASDFLRQSSSERTGGE